MRVEIEELKRALAVKDTEHRTALAAKDAELGENRLLWTSTTKLSVADPEELFRQRGLRELIRRRDSAALSPRYRRDMAEI